MIYPMQNAAKSALDYHALSMAELVENLLARDAVIAALQQQLLDLKSRVDWFTRQLFGSKSERLTLLDNPQQLHLGEVFAVPESPVAATQREVPAHRKR